MSMFSIVKHFENHSFHISSVLLNVAALERLHKRARTLTHRLQIHSEKTLESLRLEAQGHEHLVSDTLPPQYVSVVVYM